MNTAIYPITVAEDSVITFTGSVPSGASADVRFRFEANPYPATEPSFDTVAVTVTGSDSATYSIAVPSQGANTFNSLVMYLNTRDVGVAITDIAISAADGDTGSGDTGCVVIQVAAILIQSRWQASKSLRPLMEPRLARVRFTPTLRLLRTGLVLPT